jgi:hypothetical protein
VLPSKKEADPSPGIDQAECLEYAWKINLGFTCCSDYKKLSPIRDLVRRPSQDRHADPVALEAGNLAAWLTPLPRNGRVIQSSESTA